MATFGRKTCDGGGCWRVMLHESMSNETGLEVISAGRDRRIFLLEIYDGTKEADMAACEYVRYAYNPI